MRKIIHILLSLCLLCSLLAGTACAAGRTCSLDEVGLSVTVPDSLAAFTRDFDPDDPELAAFGLSEELLQSAFNDGNNYLIALDRELGHEVLISVVDNGSDQKVFETLSEPVSADMLSAISESYGDMGLQIIDQPKVRSHDPVNFLVLNCTLPIEGYTLNCLMYITAYEGKSIGIILRSYLGEITAEQEALARSLADSMVFDPPEAPHASALLGSILLAIFITVVIYSLPIIIYRYAIRKSPVPRKKAKKITVIYAIVFFFLASILLFTTETGGASGFAIILWSFINYRMLVGGKNTVEQDLSNMNL